jgi:hypothetical protein
MHAAGGRKLCARVDTLVPAYGPPSWSDQLYEARVAGARFAPIRPRPSTGPPTALRNFTLRRSDRNRDSPNQPRDTRRRDASAREGEMMVLLAVACAASLHGAGRAFFCPPLPLQVVALAVRGVGRSPGMPMRTRRGPAIAFPANPGAGVRWPPSAKTEPPAAVRVKAATRQRISAVGHPGRAAAHACPERFLSATASGALTLRQRLWQRETSHCPPKAGRTANPLGDWPPGSPHADVRQALHRLNNSP